MQVMPDVAMTGGEIVINALLGLLLAVCVVLGIYLLTWMGFLPGRVADERGHPRAAAIKVCSWTGILVVTLPVWVVALAWAYAQPYAREPGAGSEEA